MWNPRSWFDEWDADDQEPITKKIISGSAGPVVATNVDGDTLKVRYNDRDVRTTRLIGIDAPETVHPNKPVQPFGPEASARMGELVKDRPLVPAMGFEDQDRYGRDLRYMDAWPPGEGAEGPPIDVGLQMIREGLANLTTFDHPRRQEYAASLKQAMETQVGMWAYEEASKGTPYNAIQRQAVEKGIPGLYSAFNEFLPPEPEQWTPGPITNPDFQGIPEESPLVDITQQPGGPEWTNEMPVPDMSVEALTQGTPPAQPSPWDNLFARTDMPLVERIMDLFRPEELRFAGEVEGPPTPPDLDEIATEFQEYMRVNQLKNTFERLGIGPEDVAFDEDPRSETRGMMAVPTDQGPLVLNEQGLGVSNPEQDQNFIQFLEQNRDQILGLAKNVAKGSSLDQLETFGRSIPFHKDMPFPAEGPLDIWEEDTLRGRITEAKIARSEAVQGAVAAARSMDYFPMLAAEAGKFTGKWGEGTATAIEIGGSILTGMAAEKAAVTIARKYGISSAREALEVAGRKFFTTSADDIADAFPAGTVQLSDLFMESEQAFKKYNQAIADLAEKKSAFVAVDEAAGETLYREMAEAGGEAAEKTVPDRIEIMVRKFDQLFEEESAKALGRTTTEGAWESSRHSLGRWFTHHAPKVREMIEQGDISGAWRYMEHLTKVSRISGVHHREEMKAFMYDLMTPEELKATFAKRTVNEGLSKDSVANMEYIDEAINETNDIISRLKSEKGALGKKQVPLTAEEKIAISNARPEERGVTSGIEQEIKPVKTILEKLGTEFPRAKGILHGLQFAKDVEERFIGSTVKNIWEASSPWRARSANMLHGHFRKGGLASAIRLGNAPRQGEFGQAVLKVFGSAKDDASMELLLKKVPAEFHEAIRKMWDQVAKPIKIWEGGKAVQPEMEKLRAAVKLAWNRESDPVAGIQAYATELVEKASRENWNSGIIKNIDRLIYEGREARKELIKAGLNVDIKAGQVALTESEEKWLMMLREALQTQGTYHKAAQAIRMAMALEKLPMVAVSNIPQMAHALLRSRTRSVARALWRNHMPDWLGGARTLVRERAILDGAAIDGILAESQAMLLGGDISEGTLGKVARKVVGRYYRLEPVERFLRTVTNEVAHIESEMLLRQARRMMTTDDGRALLEWSAAMSKSNFKFTNVIPKSIGRQRAMNFWRNMMDFYGVREVKELDFITKMSDERFAKFLEHVQNKEWHALRDMKEVGIASGRRVVNMSRRFIEKTQFRVGLEQLPLRVNAPNRAREIIRTVGQFRTFTYKHMQEVVGWAFGEATKGNYIPLMRFLLVSGFGLGQVSGELVNDIKGFVMGWDRPGGNPIRVGVDWMFGNITTEEAQRELAHMGRPELLFERQIDNALAWGGFGLATDAWSSMKEGNVTKLFNFAVGPGMTAITKIMLPAIAGVGKTVAGDFDEALGQFTASGKALVQEAVPLGIGTSLARRFPGSRNIETFEAPLFDYANSQVFGDLNRARGVQRQADISKYEADVAAGRIPEPPKPELKQYQQKWKEKLEKQYREAVAKGDRRQMEAIRKAAKKVDVTLDVDEVTRAGVTKQRFDKLADQNRLRADYIEAFQRKDLKAMSRIRTEWLRKRLGKINWYELTRGL